MIVGRVVYQGSKLSLNNLWRDTALWSLWGIGLGEGRPDEDDCCGAMDDLLARQAAIQKTLARKHLKNGCLVLYDVTSSYFEGEYQGRELVDWGYNRDGKRGHKQIVIAMMTTDQGRSKKTARAGTANRPGPASWSGSRESARKPCSSAKPRLLSKKRPKTSSNESSICLASGSNPLCDTSAHNDVAKLVKSKTAVNHLWFNSLWLSTRGKLRSEKAVRLVEYRCCPTASSTSDTTRRVFSGSTDSSRTSGTPGSGRAGVRRGRRYRPWGT